MRRQTTPPTPDTAAQVRCALDLLRTALCTGPDIDDLTAAAQDWADDVAASDADPASAQQCAALAFAMGTAFRLLDAADAGNSIILIADGSCNASFEWPQDDSEPLHAEFAARVEQAVCRALRKGADS